jgi:hypothetical protein
VTGTNSGTASPPISPAHPISPNTWPDGSLLQVSGSPTVYLVSGGILDPFTNAQIFLASGYKWSSIQTISTSQFNALGVSGMPVLAPNGSLIKSSADTTVYVVQNGQKSGIPSMAVLNQLGLNINKLIVLSSQELQDYPTTTIQS